MNWNDEERWKEATVSTKLLLKRQRDVLRVMYEEKDITKRRSDVGTRSKDGTKEEKLLNVSVQKEVVESKWKAMKLTNDGVERE